MAGAPASPFRRSAPGDLLDWQRSRRSSRSLVARPRRSPAWRRLDIAGIHDAVWRVDLKGGRSEPSTRSRNSALRTGNLAAAPRRRRRWSSAAAVVGGPAPRRTSGRRGARRRRDSGGAGLDVDRAGRVAVRCRDLRTDPPWNPGPDGPGGAALAPARDAVHPGHRSGGGPGGRGTAGAAVVDHLDVQAIRAAVRRAAEVRPAND